LAEPTRRALIFPAEDIGAVQISRRSRLMSGNRRRNAHSENG
jgi:hypothetical protein